MYNERMEEFVERYIVRLDDGRYLMYDDVTDVEEADDVLTVKMPVSAANMFDALQTSYFIMQNYMEAQWEVMQKKLSLDCGEEPPNDRPDTDPDLYRKFAEIVLTNELEEIFKGANDDDD